jgi:hypothetical protein
MCTYQNKIIEQTIKEAINTFSNTLEKIYPAYNDNGFNERNLTFHFANAFINLRKNSNAIMEIPFYNEKNRKHDTHIDAYLFDKEIGIFLESKRMNNLSKANEVSNDLINKMNKKNLSYIRKKCHLNEYPEKTFIMVLCETWNEGHKSWWTKDKYISEEWKDISFPYKLYYGRKDVKKWKDESLLSWLYAYKLIKF